MSRFAHELMKKFGTPQAVFRRLGMDEKMLDQPGSAGLSANEARAQLLDLIDALDDGEVVEFANQLRDMAGDKRGIRAAARDARELDDFERRNGEDMRRRATADSLRSRPRSPGRDDLPTVQSRSWDRDGEMMNPRGGQDRRQAHDSMAMDARTGLPSFDSMFPDAAGIVSGGGY